MISSITIPSQWDFHTEKKESIHTQVASLAREATSTENAPNGLRRAMRKLLDILEDPTLDPNATENGITLLECALKNWESILEDPSEKTAPWAQTDNLLHTKEAVLPLPEDPPWNGEGYLHPCELPAAVLLRRGANPFPDGSIRLLQIAVKTRKKINDTLFVTPMNRIIHCMLRHPNCPQWNQLVYEGPEASPLLHNPDLNLMKTLLDNGCPIDIRDGNGNTALMKLIGTSSMENPIEAEAQYLLKQGASPLAIDNKGLSVVKHMMFNLGSYYGSFVTKRMEFLGEAWGEAVKRVLENSEEKCLPALKKQAAADACFSGWNDKVHNDIWKSLTLSDKEKAAWKAIHGILLRGIQQTNPSLTFKALWSDFSRESAIIRARGLINLANKYKKNDNLDIWKFQSGMDEESVWDEVFNNMRKFITQIPQDTQDIEILRLDQNTEWRWISFLTSWARISFDHPLFQESLFPYVNLVLIENIEVEKRKNPGSSSFINTTLVQALEDGIKETENDYPRRRADSVKNNPEKAARLLETWSLVSHFSDNKKAKLLRNALIKTPGWLDTLTGKRFLRTVEIAASSSMRPEYWAELHALLLENTLHNNLMTGHGRGTLRRHRI